MMTDAVAVTENPLAFPIPELSEETRAKFADSKARNTVEAYRVGLGLPSASGEVNPMGFLPWCQRKGFSPLPAHCNTVVEFLSELEDAGLSLATIRLRLAAINFLHSAKAPGAAGGKAFEVREFMKGVARRIGKPSTKKNPLLTDDVKNLVAFLDGEDGLKAARDKAMILAGFCGAFRRGELGTIQAENVTFSPEGMTMLLTRSKTDTEGKGFLKAVKFGSNSDTCAVRAMRRWLERSGITSGPVFRGFQRRGEQMTTAGISGFGVAKVLLERMSQAGIDPEGFGGHSMRRGFCIQASRNGASIAQIKAISGHRSTPQVVDYQREADTWRSNVTGSLGL